MTELTNEDVKKFKEWSEGNRELFELFCWCKRCNIATFSSCGGHVFEEMEEHGVDPYVAIVIDSNSINYIEEMISELRDVQELSIDAGYMKEIDTKSFCVHAIPSNCSEVFHKMKLAIIKHQKREQGEIFVKKESQSSYRYLKEKQILSGAKKIERSSNDELKKYKQSHYKLDSISKEFKKFRGNITLGRLFGTRIILPKSFMDSYKKYGQWQNQYTPLIITEWEDLRAQIINDEFGNFPVELCVIPELEEEINKKVWSTVKKKLLSELQSRGITFDVTYHDCNKDSSYYANDERLDNGEARYIIDIPEELEHSTNENTFDNINLFEYVYSMFHEYRHIMQRKEYIYDAINTEENKTFAKTEIISRYIASYDEANYANDPREIDAQIYGIEQAIQYFLKNFPWIDEEKCCVEFVKKFTESQMENRIQKIIF